MIIPGKKLDKKRQSSRTVLALAEQREQVVVK